MTLLCSGTGTIKMEWYWNDKDGSITNGANPKYHLENDYGWGMLAKSTSGVEHFPGQTKRKWWYE
jgi:hypothetical protein